MYDILILIFFIQLYPKQMGKTKTALNKYINLMWQMRMSFLNEIATHSNHTELNKPNNCVVFSWAQYACITKPICHVMTQPSKHTTLCEFSFVHQAMI